MMKIIFLILLFSFHPLYAISLLPARNLKTEGDVVRLNSHLVLRQTSGSVKAKAELYGICNRPGRNYRLSYDIRGTGGSSDATGFQFYRLQLFWNAGGREVKRIANDWQDTTKEHFQKKWLDFTAPAEPAQLQLVFQIRGAGGIEVGNLSLTECPEIPKPLFQIEFSPFLYRNSIYATLPAGTVDGRIVCNQKQSGPFKISLCADDGRVIWEKQTGERFSFPAEELPQGKYRLCISNGSIIVKEILHKYPPVSSEVVIDSHKRLLVNGKPFRPVFIWSLKKAPYWEDTPEDRALLAQAAEHGVNTLVTRFRDMAHASQVLELAGRFGMKVILMPNSFRNMPLTPEKLAKWKRHLTELLPLPLRQHPALLCYFIADEPLWTGKAREGILAMYHALKEFDPYHPVWINMAPRNEVADLSQYAEAADIFGVDIYPYPAGNSHSGLPDKGLTCVGKYAERMKQSVSGLKPVWMMLQGFAWGDLSGSKAEYPTLADLRFMTWQTLTRHTVPCYWGAHYVKNPDFLNVLYRMTSELEQLAPVLNGIAVAPSPVKVSDPRISFSHWKNAGKEWLLVLNESPSVIMAEFDTPYGKITRKLISQETAVIQLR